MCLKTIFLGKCFSTPDNKNKYLSKSASLMYIPFFVLYEFKHVNADEKGEIKITKHNYVENS